MAKRGDRLRWAAVLASALVASAGCGSQRAHIDQAVTDRRPPPAPPRPAAAYQARCPDVVRVDVAGLPQYSGPRAIGPDGRIDLGDAGRPRVDGETAAEIVRTVAETVGVPAEQVRAEVAEYNSQFLYLFGEVAGLQRVVPYRGPERVVDLLRRAGGLTPGAAVQDVRVIRPHVAEGKTPEVFHIDLAAIVRRNDPETNILVEPYDQIHVGQSKRSSFRSCLPPWLRPAFDRLCGMKHPAPDSER